MALIDLGVGGGYDADLKSEHCLAAACVDWVYFLAVRDKKSIASWVVLH